MVGDWITISHAVDPNVVATLSPLPCAENTVPPWRASGTHALAHSRCPRAALRALSLAPKLLSPCLSAASRPARAPKPRASMACAPRHVPISARARCCSGDALTSQVTQRQRHVSQRRCERHPADAAVRARHTFSSAHLIAAPHVSNLTGCGASERPRVQVSCACACRVA